MKKFSAFLMAASFILLFGMPAFGQQYPTDKGSKMLLGEVSFTSQSGDLYENSDGDGSTTLSIRPSFGVFIVPGFAIAGDLIYDRTAQANVSYTVFGIAPKVTYFIGGNKKPAAIKGSTLPFVGLGFGYVSHTSKSTWENWASSQEALESTTNGTVIVLGGGILHMLSGSLGMVGELNYQMDKLKPEEGDSVSGNVFMLRIGITGFLY